MTKLNKSVYRVMRSNLLKAILVNLCALIGLLICFEPTPKQDDYNQVMILYGGFTGEYSEYTLYVNAIFSKVIQLLLNLFPEVSWYYVLQYGLIFMSLTIITYIFIKKSIAKEWMVPTLLTLIFCGYELYIRFTFTTVAGIAIISGFLMMLYLIEDRDRLCFQYFIGYGLIFCGMLLRNNMYALVTAVFFSAFIIYISRNYKTNKPLIGKKVVLFVMLVLTMFITQRGLLELDLTFKSNSKEWKYFNEVNARRSDLQDYGMPSYDRYKEEYSSLGMTYNDYISWKNEGLYNDYEFFNPERLKQIREIETVQGNNSFSKILLNSSRRMIAYYLGDTGIYLLLSAIICIVFFRKGKLLIYIIPVLGCCISIYFYMAYQGRLKHHVDVSVLIAGAVLLFYYGLPSNVKRIDYRKIGVLLGTLVLIYIGFNSNGLYYSSYYGSYYGSGRSQREEYESNKEKLSLLSEDNEHFYLFGTNSTDFVFNREWTAFDVVSPGYYHNMISGGFFHQPDTEKILENYEIENMYKEITNSQLIYVATVDESQTFIDTLSTYINEHYMPGAYYTKVKKIDNLNIYRFTEGAIKPVWKDMPLQDSADVTSDISVTETIAGEISVAGYAFVNGCDSYAQNIYLAVTDKITGETVYAYPLQSENDLFITKDKYHGRYSNFSGSIARPQDSQDVEISIYIQTEKGLYRLKV